MDEPVRWVTKVDADSELDISPSTLDRRIKRGEIEVAKEGRRVYVRMEGHKHPSDQELLRHPTSREDELARTVQELERKASEAELRASERERERDEARESASNIRERYEKLREAFRKEKKGHESTESRLWVVGLFALALLAVTIIFALRLWT